MSAGEGVDPAVMHEVAKMVAQSCSTCSKAMRAEGVKVPHVPPPHHHAVCPATLTQLCHMACTITSLCHHYLALWPAQCRVSEVPLANA